MPRGPRGERRPGAVIKVARIATGEIENDIRRPEDEGKDPAAVTLGRRGGQARAKGLSQKRRKEIARKAAQARWKD